MTRGGDRAAPRASRRPGLSLSQSPWNPAASIRGASAATISWSVVAAQADRDRARSCELLEHPRVAERVLLHARRGRGTRRHPRRARARAPRRPPGATMSSPIASKPWLPKNPVSKVRQNRRVRPSSRASASMRSSRAWPTPVVAPIVGRTASVRTSPRSCHMTCSAPQPIERAVVASRRRGTPAPPRRARRDPCRAGCDAARAARRAAGCRARRSCARGGR